MKVGRRCGIADVVVGVALDRRVLRRDDVRGVGSRTGPLVHILARVQMLKRDLLERSQSPGARNEAHCILGRVFF